MNKKIGVFLILLLIGTGLCFADDPCEGFLEKNDAKRKMLISDLIQAESILLAIQNKDMTPEQRQTVLDGWMAYGFDAFIPIYAKYGVKHTPPTFNAFIENAILEMAKIHPEEVIALLIELSTSYIEQIEWKEDFDHASVLQNIYFMRQLSDPQTAPVLARLLEEANPEVSKAAYKALRSLQKNLARGTEQNKRLRRQIDAVLKPYRSFFGRYRQPQRPPELTPEARGELIASLAAAKIDEATLNIIVLTAFGNAKMVPINPLNVHRQRAIVVLKEYLDGKPEPLQASIQFVLNRLEVKISKSEMKEAQTLDTHTLVEELNSPDRKTVEKTFIKLAYLFSERRFEILSSLEKESLRFSAEVQKGIQDLLTYLKQEETP